MSVIAIKTLIVFCALTYGVNPALALRICELESDFNVTAVGDQGDAVGLWQWHKPSWEVVRRHMGKPTTDLRADPVESTETAMYAMGEMGLGRWWSTYEIAKANVEDAGTPTAAAREVEWIKYKGYLIEAELRRAQRRYERAAAGTKEI